MLPFGNPGLLGSSAGGKWNPADKTAGLVLSGGNLVASAPVTNANYGVRSVSSKTAGKWVYEIKCLAGFSGTSIGMGFANSSWARDSTNLGTGAGGLGLGHNGIGQLNGGLFYNNAVLGYAVNDTVCWALDITNRLVWVRVFHVSGGFSDWNANPSANPATGVGGLDFSALTGAIFMAMGIVASPDSYRLNTGQTALLSPVVGFQNWS